MGYLNISLKTIVFSRLIVVGSTKKGVLMCSINSYMAHTFLRVADVKRNYPVAAIAVKALPIVFLAGFLVLPLVFAQFLIES